jgi:hypothetical protein
MYTNDVGELVQTTKLENAYEFLVLLLQIVLFLTTGYVFHLVYQASVNKSIKMEVLFLLLWSMITQALYFARQYTQVSPQVYWVSSMFGYCIMGIALMIQMNILNILVHFASVSDPKRIKILQGLFLVWWVGLLGGRIVHLETVGQAPTGLMKLVKKSHVVDRSGFLYIQCLLRVL